MRAEQTKTCKNLYKRNNEVGKRTEVAATGKQTADDN